MRIKRGNPYYSWPWGAWPDLPAIAETVSDGTTNSDSAARLLRALRIATDGAALSDTTGRFVVVTRAAVDGLLANDTALAGLNITGRIVDGYIIGQLPDGAGVFLVGIGDGLTIDDSFRQVIAGLMSMLFEIRLPQAAYALRQPTITIVREVNNGNC